MDVILLIFKITYFQHICPAVNIAVRGNYRLHCSTVLTLVAVGWQPSIAIMSF